jgi:hypothetical protein
LAVAEEAVVVSVVVGEDDRRGMTMKKTNIHQQHKLFSLIITGLVAISLVTFAGPAGFSQDEPEVGGSAQAHFGTAEELVNHLVIALARADMEALKILFGEGFEELIPAEGMDGAITDKFLSAWAMRSALIPQDETTRTLAVGNQGWTFPVPIVLADEGWAFDTPSGIEEVRTRRIGRNELAVMQALLAYRDAQFDYSSKDRDGDGVIEYAQKVLSTPGSKDGLFWETEEGSEEISPLGPLFAENKPGDTPYLGYRYRILTAQGESAGGGAMDYVVDGNMVGGFALIAWPAEYEDTGIMSFIINQEGTVYEADLGSESESIAGEIDTYNPDETWKPVPAGFTDIDAL